ncbi:hypothetical protein GCM10027347_23110 [Larkinella harenae]
MRYLLLLASLLFVLTSCGDRSRGSETADQSADSTASATTNPVCYQQISGNDTTRLRLVIEGSVVTGELTVLPFEKDRASGPINGIITNNQIRADWQRSGEGVVQPYEITFTLTGDAVIWREGERVDKQGRWVLKDPESGFEYKLLKTECP